MLWLRMYIISKNRLRPLGVPDSDGIRKLPQIPHNSFSIPDTHTGLIQSTSLNGTQAAFLNQAFLNCQLIEKYTRNISVRSLNKDLPTI